MPDSVEKDKDTPKPAPADSSAKRIALAPRQNAASGDRDPQAPAAPPVDPASLGQQIAAALLQVLGGSATKAPAPTPASERGLIAREEKRFRRGAAGEEEAEAEPPQLAPPVKLVEKRSRRGQEPAVEKPAAKAEPPSRDDKSEKSEKSEKSDKSDEPVKAVAAEKAAEPEKAATGKVEEEAKEPVAEIKAEPLPKQAETAEPVSARSEVEQAEFDNERGYFERGPTGPRAEAPPLRVIWRRIPLWRRQAIIAAGLVLVLGFGFLAGRFTAPEVYSAPPPVPGEKPQQAPLADAPKAIVARLAEPAEIKLIDDAAAAQSAGNFAKAEEILNRLAKDAPDVKGVQLTLALLNLQRGEMAQADYHISLGLSTGEDAGRLHGLRALVRARTGRPKLANESFELAQRGAPFEWKYFFLHAEALRRFGKLQQALEKYDQALSRVHEQGEDELMQFKRRLTLVAIGRGAELDADIRKQLAVPLPHIDWLMIAVAREAQQGNFAAAAVPLKRASETTSRELLAEKLRDFYMYQFCYEKELEPYYRPIMAQLRPVAAEAPPVTEDKPEAPLQGPAAMGGSTSPQGPAALGAPLPAESPSETPAEKKVP